MCDELEQAVADICMDVHTGDALEMLNRIPELFEKIKHGEPGHEAWLKEAIKCHFLGQPMPEYVAR